MKLINECWALIPARSGSKTIKDKNIKLLNKKPLIYYSLDVAKKCKYFKKIIFSSDSNKYLTIASNYGKFYLHKRDYYSSTDAATDLDIFRGFIRDHLKNNFILPKYFAHLRPTIQINERQSDSSYTLAKQVDWICSKSHARSITKIFCTFKTNNPN